MPEEALAGAGVGVRVDEPLQLRIVVPGLEVIEAGIVVLVVAPVAKGVHEGDEVGGRGIGNQVPVGVPDCRHLAPRVVIVGRNQGHGVAVILRPVPPVQTNDVPLQILAEIVVGVHRIRCALDFQPVKAVQLFIVGYFLSDLPHPEHN